MGRGGGDEFDNDKILYGDWRFRRPARPEPDRPPGILGPLHDARVQEVVQEFEVWEGSSWFSTYMEDGKGQRIDESELAPSVEEYLGQSLTRAFPDLMEDGITGTATYDVKGGSISLEIWKTLTREESAPWRAETTKEVLAALESIDATGASITFNGYGDSGMAEHVDFEGPAATKKIPKAERLKIEELLGDFVIDQLDARMMGWEINSGSYGTAKITLGKEKTEFDFFHRIEETEELKAKVDPESGDCQIVEEASAR